MSLGLSTFHSFSDSIFLAGATCVSALGAQIIPKVLSYFKKSRSCEKEADLTSAQYFPETTPGGSYFFNLMCEQGKFERTQSLIKRFDDVKNHASVSADSEREEYLKKLHPRENL